MVIIEKAMDIDLVYLWVDGSDPVWRAKKRAFEKGVPTLQVRLLMRRASWTITN